MEKVRNFAFFSKHNLPNYMLKSITGGIEEDGPGGGVCNASALCEGGKSVSCSGASSCSGFDYDRVICDGVATDCPEC